MLRAISQEFEVAQTARSYLDLLNIFKRFVMRQALSEQKILVLIIDEAQTLKARLPGGRRATRVLAERKVEEVASGRLVSAPVGDRHPRGPITGRLAQLAERDHLHER